MLANDIHDEFKAAIFYQEFPRFVWVTEFGAFESLNHQELKDRRIYAHAVHDPTASKFWEGRLAFHAPGFGKRWYHDPDNPFEEYIDTVIPLDNDKLYFPKLRGHQTFDIFRHP